MTSLVTNDTPCASRCGGRRRWCSSPYAVSVTHQSSHSNSHAQTEHDLRMGLQEQQPIRLRLRKGDGEQLSSRLHVHGRKKIPSNRPFFFILVFFSKKQFTFKPINNLFSILDPLLHVIDYGVKATQLAPQSIVPSADVAVVARAAVVPTWPPSSVPQILTPSQKLRRGPSPSFPFSP